MKKPRAAALILAVVALMLTGAIACDPAFTEEVAPEPEATATIAPTPTPEATPTTVAASSTPTPTPTPSTLATLVLAALLAPTPDPTPTTAPTATTVPAPEPAPTSTPALATEPAVTPTVTPIPGLTLPDTPAQNALKAVLDYAEAHGPTLAATLAKQLVEIEASLGAVPESELIESIESTIVWGITDVRIQDGQIVVTNVATSAFTITTGQSPTIKTTVSTTAPFLFYVSEAEVLRFELPDEQIELEVKIDISF